MTLCSLVARLRERQISPREAVQGYLDQIELLDPVLNAYISVRAEEALAEAADLERTKEQGPLYGVPVAIKDLIDVAGSRTTAASKILADNVARQDAFVVSRLRAAGAIVLGKLNLHEFAFGGLTTSAHFGAAHNPWAPERICGGSSGGSGAAVAADLAAATLGTDTGGSVRIPAAFCGVTGLRPTTGRVSTRGVIPLSWSCDTVGPICHTAEDCALLLGTIAGHDPGHGSTFDLPVPRYVEALTGDIHGLRIGIVDSLMERDIDPRIATLVKDAIGEFDTLGASCRAVDIPLLEHGGTIQQLIWYPEATTYHLPWLRTRLEDYGADVRFRLLAGLGLPPAAYVVGQRGRRLLLDELRQVFRRFDLLLAPTMPVVAPRIGEEQVVIDGQEIPYRISLIRMNFPWSAVGIPAASIPCGFVDGLPVGMALVGWRFCESTVLRAAHAFQMHTDWHARRPDLNTALSLPSHS